jgi:ArsR family transcriptional regulator, arsenate/arsenite/antimonite-responsive transcriptional repressor / arsenate reductase (thioredoxin)
VSPIEGPPPVLRLVGHPVRWRLLTELARSDRRVQELRSLVGEPQSLVSYHLGQLLQARLVRTRRSSFDGRQTYYSVDLSRCAELLAGVGGALHPGLRLVVSPAEERRPGRRRGSQTSVLFLCTGNSARSQMAEALVEKMADGEVVAVSAGSHPKPVHPNTVKVMRSYDIDLAGRSSKHLSEFSGRRFDYVISLCDRVREVCPPFAGGPQALHWSIPDPSREGDADIDTYPAFERTAAELETRIGFLLQLIDHSHQSGRKPT